MKGILAILMIIFLFNCKQNEKKIGKLPKTIEVGDYLFDFPDGFKLVPERGVDSYVGKIKADSILLDFDFGYYSNELQETPQQYLEQGSWKNELPYRFMKAGITYDQDNIPKVEIIHIRPATKQDSSTGKGCDYIAKCMHNKTVFEFAIYIPTEIKQTNFAIDTIDNIYRKIVWAKDPRKGITGIYLKDLEAYNESMNSCPALSMATNKLTIQQQEKILTIFKTGRRKNKK